MIKDLATLTLLVKQDIKDNTAEIKELRKIKDDYLNVEKIKEMQGRNKALNDVISYINAGNII